MAGLSRTITRRVLACNADLRVNSRTQAFRRVRRELSRNDTASSAGRIDCRTQHTERSRAIANDNTSGGPPSVDFSVDCLVQDSGSELVRELLKAGFQAGSSGAIESDTAERQPQSANFRVLVTATRWQLVESHRERWRVGLRAFARTLTRRAGRRMRTFSNFTSDCRM